MTVFSVVTTPCDVANGNCEQLCLLGASRTARCACVAGYTLAGDGRSCSEYRIIGFMFCILSHKFNSNSALEKITISVCHSKISKYSELPLYAALTDPSSTMAPTTPPLAGKHKKHYHSIVCKLLVYEL